MTARRVEKAKRVRSSEPRALVLLALARERDWVKGAVNSSSRRSHPRESGARPRRSRRRRRSSTATSVVSGSVLGGVPASKSSSSRACSEALVLGQRADRSRTTASTSRRSTGRTTIPMPRLYSPARETRTSGARPLT
ncbi:hypothetical protein HY251_00785 [bacterium]|nr:hypothetical protein [bacterium]